ncbi:MAG TPA: hypothetical protein VKC58_14385 [Myxococcales bacterium]|nr:hypothetical protein [Myxococcales bacterium]
MRTAMLLLLCATAAGAQDAFEIQVYDVSTAPALTPGVELHVNGVLQGSEQRSPAGELPTNHVVHATLEPHLGLTDWLEAGAYLQSALRPDGTYDYAGTKLRMKARLLEPAFGWLYLALNGELSWIPPEYEAARRGGELRPILEAHSGRLGLWLNPIVSFELHGGFHPELAPCAKAAWSVSEAVSLGVEYYSVLGRIEGLSPVSEQVHRAFGVIDLATRWLGLNLGVGGGSGADSFIVKAILEVHPPEG